ncbi:MAG: amidohydrolase family protein [bacterium]|nr:amidohydrolase family protein [bacterium]
MEFKITDVNCSLGYPVGVRPRFHDLNGLLQAMDTYRISESVAFHTEALRDAIMGNRLAREAAGESVGRVSSCYVLRSDLGGSEIPAQEELLAQLRAERPAAVRLYPRADGYILDAFYAGELLEVLNELGLPVLLDPDQYPPYESLPALAASFPNIKFVLLRQRINQTRYTRPLVSKLENVFFDISIMIDTCFIEEAISKYGSGRFLFGSAMPQYLPAGALGLILYSRISDDDKAAILSGNWRSVQEGIRWK